MKKLFFLMLLLLSGTVLMAQDITGTWTGAITIPQGELHINFNVSSTEEGYTSTLDSPDQNAYGIPVDSTFFENKVLRIVVNQIDFQYTGLLEDAQHIKGEMLQHGQTFELNLVRKEKE